MHPPDLHDKALRMHADGLPFAEIHRRLGLSRNTVAYWLYNRRSAPPEIHNRCPRCDRPPRKIDDQAGYAYLLGQYLGDGHLLTTQRVPLLTVTCDWRYPGLMHEVTHAMEACGARTVGYQEKVGCISVRAYWTHWPCLIPQHGPGAKHHRKIELADWQREIVDAQAERFLRGLFHSDGSRFTNRVTRNGANYDYPRYNFVNESADIMQICIRSLDHLEIAWRMARRNTLSVARREAVARLDEFIGPKW